MYESECWILENIGLVGDITNLDTHNQQIHFKKDNQYYIYMTDLSQTESGLDLRLISITVQ